MKVPQRMLDGRTRKSVEIAIGREQGFRKCRGTEDGMFTMKQLVEKRLEVLV